MKISDFQTITFKWMKDCFGDEIASDKKTRSLALLEEALELCQATGVTVDEVLKQTDYTYNRPAGEINQEVGGVMIALAGLCAAHGLKMEGAMQYAIAYCTTNTRKIRAKQKDKVKAGIRHLLPPDGKNAEKPALKCDWDTESIHQNNDHFRCSYCGELVGVLSEELKSRPCPKRKQP